MMGYRGIKELYLNILYLRKEDYTRGKHYILLLQVGNDLRDIKPLDNF